MFVSGRARAQDSHYYVISEEGSAILAKEEMNAILEELMLLVVPVLQADIEDNQNLWERDSLIIQLEAKQIDDVEEENHRRTLTAEPMEIQCINCSTTICKSKDLRTIQKAHHILVNKEFADRLIMARSPIPAFQEEDLKYDGQVFCSNPECRGDLGGVCEYKSLEFPLLSLKRLRFVKSDGQGACFKQWKRVACYIAELTLDDLREIVEERRANM